MVPVYGSEATLDATIRSVLGQTRSDLELIVVDDGSPDASAAIATRWTERDARVRLLRQANAGTAAARAAGAAQARGRLISFLDADDLWLPGYLERIAQALPADTGAGLGCCDAWLLDDASGRVHRWRALRFYRNAIPPLPQRLDAPECLRRLLRLNFLTTCTVTVTRAAYEVVGGIDPRIRGVDDWDLWLRIVDAGLIAVRVPETLAVLRKRSRSQSADRELMGREAERVLVAALERDPEPRAAAVARRHLAALRAELGASPAASALGGVRRRLGARRLRVWRFGEWRPAPPEVSRLLSPPAREAR